MVNGARGIRSEKLRDMERYARCLEIKRIDWEERGNVEQIWEQLK